MKKLVLSLAVLFTVALVSCDGKKDANANDSANPETAAVENVEVENVNVEVQPVDSPVANDSVQNPA